MMIQYEFCQSTLKCLRESGWFVGRAVDVAPFASGLIKKGYDIFPAATEFLRSFGGLRVVHPHAKVWAMNDFFVLNPADAAYLDDHRDEVEKWAGEILCPIGVAHRKYMDLLMAVSGTVYVYMDGLLLRVASSGPAAIEAICTGAEYENIQ
jgi:hypothetical protein